MSDFKEISKKQSDAGNCVQGMRAVVIVLNSAGSADTFVWETQHLGFPLENSILSQSKYSLCLSQIQ